MPLQEMPGYTPRVETNCNDCPYKLSSDICFTISSFSSVKNLPQSKMLEAIRAFENNYARVCAFAPVLARKAREAVVK